MGKQNVVLRFQTHNYSTPTTALGFTAEGAVQITTQSKR